MQRQLSTGEVAREAQISEHRVRVYADAGLIPCERDPSGKRFFAPNAPEIARAVFEQRYSRVCRKEEIMEQRTDDWYQARLGKVTASRVSEVIAKGKGATRESYMADLIVERLTGQRVGGFTTTHMEWGTEQEPHARAAYSAHAGELVEEVGFVDHPRITNAGASPDGLVGDEGLVEVKCPATSTHLDTLLAGEVPTKHLPQMQWQMACTGRKWCDFVSYDPRLPEHLRMFVKRVERDDKHITTLEKEVTSFLSELEEKLIKLQELKRG